MVNLVCPPYDIIKESEIKRYLNKSPYNIIRLELPTKIDSYKSVKDVFDIWKKNKILIKDNEDCIYIYQMEFNVLDEKKYITGIICLVKIEELENSTIIPHENTFKAAKQNRLELLKAINCNISPIYALFDGRDNLIFNVIKSLSKKKYDINFMDADGITHRLWRINDKNIINEISNYFKEKNLFIADGHHRYETAVDYKDYCKKFKNQTADYTMMLLADLFSKDLTINPTHRLVRLNSDFSLEKFEKSLADYFSIEKRKDINRIESVLKKELENGKKVLGFYCRSNAWLLLTLKSNNLLKNFYCETQILEDLILNKSLKYKELFYTKDLKNGLKSVNSQTYDALFVIPEMSKKTLIKIFLNRIKLPQKTTYFYPKPITGLVMHELDS